MSNPTGFLEHTRQLPTKQSVAQRLGHWGEFVDAYPPEQLHAQASRCMDCGVPFCHNGCPLGNVIPEFNDAVWKGNWQQAYEILISTNNFPEFTGRVCPAPCESACVLGIHQPAVAIEEIEKHIIEIAFAEGLVKPNAVFHRTGKKVAVVGSGPAGLAAAAQLNLAGHHVTVFERDEKPGGLLRYGIPDFKLEKSVVERRIQLLEQEGIVFRCNAEVGRNIPISELLYGFDAIVLAGGSTVPRDLKVPGRELQGVHFAMDFLKQQNLEVSRNSVPGQGLQVPRNSVPGLNLQVPRNSVPGPNLKVSRNAIPEPSVSERSSELHTQMTPELRSGVHAQAKNIIIIGGGDTGSDCIGTSNRQGAASVTQFELLPQPPSERSLNMPWPTYPMLYKTTSSHEEGCERHFAITTKAFLGDEKGQLRAVLVADLDWKTGADGRPSGFQEIPGSEREIPCELALLAMGFVHPQHEGMLQQLEIALDERGNVFASDQNYQTNHPKIFSAGDMRRGQSLVVWAIQEGRECARCVDEFLTVGGG